MRRFILISTHLLIVLGFTSSVLSQSVIQAPNQHAEPINQRRAYGNSCGPASLLNAFQYGSPAWKKVFDRIPGKNSRSRILYVVAKWGNKPSNHIKGASRWNPKAGINLLDLTDMANEMRGHIGKSKIRYEVLTKKNKTTRVQLLKRCHTLMIQSLKNGFPPILSIRRYAKRYNRKVGGKYWGSIQAHFVVLIEVPATLPNGATSFKIKYADPFGGFVREGVIKSSPGAFTHSPFLTASMPHTSVGKSFLKANEPTVLTLSAIIGCW